MPAATNFATAMPRLAASAPNRTMLSRMRAVRSDSVRVPGSVRACKQLCRQVVHRRVAGARATRYACVMTPRFTLAALALSTATVAHAQERVTPMTPDVVASYDQVRPEADYIKRVVMVPMRDGTKLYTVILISISLIGVVFGRFPPMSRRVRQPCVTGSPVCVDGRLSSGLAAMRSATSFDFAPAVIR